MGKAFEMMFGIARLAFYLSMTLGIGDLMVGMATGAADAQIHSLSLGKIYKMLGVKR